MKSTLPTLPSWYKHQHNRRDDLSTVYWTFSDVFEEQGVAQRPFYGGFGLIAPGGIPKASFNAFKLLHMLGGQRIDNNYESVITPRRPDGSLAIAVWNYAPPGEKGAAKRMILAFKNLQGRKRVRIHLSGWEAYGPANSLARTAASPAVGGRCARAGNAHTVRAGQLPRRLNYESAWPSLKWR
jgi:hypothetical protein